MLGVHASLNHIATAVVIVRIVVGVRIIVSIVAIVVIRVEATAESEMIPEAATLKAVAMKFTAAETATGESASVEEPPPPPKLPPP